MTEHLLNDLWIDVPREKKGSTRVTQTVEGEALLLFFRPELRPLQQRLEVTVVEVVVILLPSTFAFPYLSASLDWLRSDDTSFPPLVLMSVLCEPFARSYIRWISIGRFSDLVRSL